MIRRIDIKICGNKVFIEIIEYYQKGPVEVYIKWGCDMSGAAARTGNFRNSENIENL